MDCFICFICRIINEFLKFNLMSSYELKSVWQTKIKICEEQTNKKKTLLRRTSIVIL